MTKDVAAPAAPAPAAPAALAENMAETARHGGATTRRAVLGGAAAGAAAATLPAPAVARQRRRLRMVTAWPKNLPGLGTAAERYAGRVAALTNGDLEIRVFAGGELVPPFESFDAVSGGAADLYHGTEYYWQGKSPAFNFFTSIPGGMTASEFTAWIRHGGGQALWDGLAAPFGVKPLLAGNSGVQMGGWFNKEITGLDDLKGLRIRLPGLAGAMMRKLGATAVNMPGAQVYSALSDNTIDAADWVAPWNDMAVGLYKAAKYYYWPGFQEPSAALSVGVNMEVWDGLSPAHRAVLEQAAEAENDAVLADFDHNNAVALKRLRDETDTAFRRFPDEVLLAMGEAAAEVAREAGAADATAGAIHESYTAYMKTAMAWTALSEHPYLDARRRVAERA
jgi:TRAP-type mannitol/chloroaromatic compound transport system substrate-binding protein